MQSLKQTLKNVIVATLIFEAKIVLRRMNPSIIMVSGSVGKTSTKDAIYTALSTIVSVRKSEKSFNSDIGVPLTVLGLKNAWSNPFLWVYNIIVGLSRAFLARDYPKWLVLEVGADRPDDLKKLLEWIKPNAVVLTRFPDVPPHVEFYDSVEHLVREESLPALALDQNGFLFVNDDDDRALTVAKESRAKVVTFGLTKRADISSSDEEIFYKETDYGQVPAGMKFSVSSKKTKSPYQKSQMDFAVKGALSVSHIYPVLAAIAVATNYGATLEGLQKELSNNRPPLGRMNILEGIKHTTLIDDTYNASPSAVLLALETLKEIKTKGRRIAVLGDMRELGSFSKEEHQKIGHLAAKICNVLLTVGKEAREISEGALDTLMDEKQIFQFDESMEAGKFLESIMKEGDVVLIKGSQGIRMEKATLEVMAHPEKAPYLLVRQDRAWGRR